MRPTQATTRPLTYALALLTLAAPTLVEAQPTVPVHVSAETDGAPLVLHEVLVAGRASRWSGRYNDLTRPLCTAPCDLDLPVGAYHFAVSAGAPVGSRVPNLVDIREPTSLVVDFQSRALARVLGWVMFGVAVASGAAIAIAGAMFAAEDTQQDLFYGLTIGGLGLVVVGTAVTLPFIALNDHASVRPALR